MLGALAMKWKWRARQEKAEEVDTSKPNLIFGGDVHVVWEKFCRYFDVEPRIVPLQDDKIVIGPGGRRAAHRREHDRRRGGPGDHLHRPRRRHRRHQRAAGQDQGATRDSTSRCTSTAPAAASSGPSSTRTPKWDFRLEQVHSINASGHKFGLVYPGIGWLIFRSRESTARGPRSSTRTTWARRDATFTLNFSTGSAMVLAQYFNFIRFGRSGYEHLMKMMQKNAERARQGHRGHRAVRADRRGRAAAAGRLPLNGDQPYDEFDVASQLAAERGWMVPAYHLPPNAAGREADAGTGQADPRLLAGREAGRGPRGRLQDAREEGRRRTSSERKRVHTATGY